MSRAVCFTDPSGALRIGALEGESVRDAGPAGPRRASCPRPRHGGRCGRPQARSTRSPTSSSKAPGRTREARLHRSQLPGSRGGDGRRDPEHADRLREVHVGADRARRGDRAALRRAASRLRGRARARDRDARSTGDRPGGARGGRRDHGLQRRVRARGAVRPRAPVHARQELRHVRAARPVHRAGRRTSTSVRCAIELHAVRRGACRTRRPRT